MNLKECFTEITPPSIVPDCEDNLSLREILFEHFIGGAAPSATTDEALERTEAYMQFWIETAGRKWREMYDVAEKMFY